MAGGRARSPLALCLLLSVSLPSAVHSDDSHNDMPLMWLGEGYVIGRASMLLAEAINAGQAPPTTRRMPPNVAVLEEGGKLELAVGPLVRRVGEVMERFLRMDNSRPPLPENLGCEGDGLNWMEWTLEQHLAFVQAATKRRDQRPGFTLDHFVGEMHHCIEAIIAKVQAKYELVRSRAIKIRMRHVASLSSPNRFGSVGRYFNEFRRHAPKNMLPILKGGDWEDWLLCRDFSQALAFVDGLQTSQDPGRVSCVMDKLNKQADDLFAPQGTTQMDAAATEFLGVPRPLHAALVLAVPKDRKKRLSQAMCLALPLGFAVPELALVDWES